MFFLKHATESSFLISIGVLFHNLVAETAKERPPFVSLLYLGQTALMLENLVLRECRLFFKLIVHLDNSANTHLFAYTLLCIYLSYVAHKTESNLAC